MQKIIFILLIISFIVGCKTSQKKEDRILFVVSNQHTYGSTNLIASNHFSEIVLAYDIFIKSGYKVDFVSPKGGAIPIGYISKNDRIQKKYLNDTDFMYLFKNTLRPNEINPLSYKATYYSGGGSAMFGVPENKEIQTISRSIYENNGIISTVCHGTAGIVNLKLSNGRYIYEEKQISGYPDFFENMDSKKYKTFPFSIEKTINKRGGEFSYSKERNANYFKEDGRLVTGQDPSSSISVAKKVVEMLQNQK
ncbi:Putative intracellular protease/amidase [Marivirga sericea]|uniref:Putative intracellular protease/amidase n=1 Tax=Marivirga sericea TaxID=1028 RepID=A0A1X7JM10_9BACT|nr:type 1 glutamine amidotransferase domain-containing protein [Marivirga sericea]SMG29093.1 Putative intracellular protease/amidase [Marivirga sericea]